MPQPDLPSLRLSEDQIAKLVDMLEEWLAYIDHEDQDGYVQLHPASIKALQEKLQPLLKKIQFVRVESLDWKWPH